MTPRRNRDAPEVREIALSLLQISPNNARQREITADLDELAASIREFGLLQPILVQQAGEKFDILIGQRRYLATKQLGKKTILARVLPRRVPVAKAKALSFSENVQRRDLTPRDKADVCKYLLKELGSPKAVAAKLGVSEQTVRKWLAYEAVPEGLKTMVERNQISRPIATRLAQYVQDEAKAVAIARRIAEMNPTKPQRDRILEAVEESPVGSVATVFRRAEEMREVRRINFILPSRWASALRRAAEDLSSDPNDIAKDATIEWLKLGRYTL